MMVWAGEPSPSLGFTQSRLPPGGAKIQGSQDVEGME